MEVHSIPLGIKLILSVIRIINKIPKPIKFACPSWIVWSISLAIYWPGMMSHDSIVQWRQLASGHIMDYQPALHTMVLWIMTRIWFTPAMVALFQILILGFSIGWFLKIIEDWGVNTQWVWIGSILVACSPINMVLSITIWKDILYTAVFIIITGLMFTIGTTKNDNYFNRKLNIILYSSLLALITLFRWNGAIIAISCLFFIWIFFRKKWKNTIYIFVTYLFIIIFFRGPIFSILDIKTSKYLFYTLPLHHMGAFLSEEYVFTEDEKDFLNQIAPIESNWDYDCNVIRGYAFSENSIYNKTFLLNNNQEFLRLYFKSMFNYPLVYLKHLKCVTSFIWNPWASMEKMQLKTVGGIRWIPYENEFGIISDSKIQFAVIPLTGYIKGTMFLWKPAIFLYLSIGVMLFAIYKHGWYLLLTFIPLLSQSVGIALVTNSQEFRYQYPIVFIGHFIWLLLLKKPHE